MVKSFSLGLIWAALKDSFRGFSDDKITKLAAALAYYTVFSLGPMLIVIIYLSSLIFSEAAIKGTIYHQLEDFIGSNAAMQVQTIIQNAGINNQSGISAVIGILALLVGATTMFAEMQDSMNSIWGVKADAKKSGIIKLLMTRLVSFGVVATLGFLLMVSLVITTVVTALGAQLQQAFPDIGFVLIYVINMALALGITTLLFAVIFKVLPNVEIMWRHVWVGSIATALLFMGGKFGISYYISQSEIGSTYGAAGSLVIIILWIYYSSIILYFGAEFTKSYALVAGAHILPDKYAVFSERPAVAGAKTKQQKDERRQYQSEKKDSAAPVRHQQYISTAVTPYASDVKSAGMGKVLLGLAIYFITGGAGKK